MRNFERKNHGLVRGILEELLKLSEALLLSVVVQHIKNPAWAIKEKPAERGKRAVHFRCFCLKRGNRHATAGNTNSMKLYLMCPDTHFFH